jgi:hypothetical protein
MYGAEIEGCTMAKANDDGVIIDATNVHAFPGAEPQQKTRAGTRRKDRRSTARRAKYRSKIKVDRDATPDKDAPPPHTDAPPIARTVARTDVTRSASVPTSPSITLSDTPGVTPAAGASINLATGIAALALATVSAGFSIVGLTSVFVGAFWPVVGMGVALELGKLSAVAWLGRHRETGWRLRAALVGLIAVLIGLNAIGAYGFLAKAHIGHQVEGETVVSARAADIEARLGVQAEKVADLTKQIADLDAARTIETPSAGNLRTASAISAQAAALAAAAKFRTADDERRQAKRTSLADKLTVEAKALADLKIEKAKVDGDRKVAEADLGPVRYLATLLGAGDQDVLRWFILVVAMLLDPAAVLLLLAATSARR